MVFNNAFPALFPWTSRLQMNAVYALLMRKSQSGPAASAIVAFLLPAFTVHVALTAYPVLRTFWNSFHKVLPRSEEHDWRPMRPSSRTSSSKRGAQYLHLASAWRR